MLDVHPPHQSAHSWRDFFIHIATIVVGLVIAVGLEQTVEMTHQASERRELLRNLHSECSDNLKITDQNIAAYGADRDWDLASVAVLEDAHPNGGFITAVLPPHPALPGTQAPSEAAWSVAKTNGNAALLPENLAEIFDRIDHLNVEFLHANDEVNVSTRHIHAVANRLRIQIKPGTALRLPVQKADELAAAFAEGSGNSYSAAFWSAYWGGACRAVLDNAQSRDAVFDYMQRAAATAAELKTEPPPRR